MEIPPSERICQFCVHCYINTGAPSYSELTPGDEFSLECVKQHWSFKRYGTETNFVRCIVAARTCADFLINPQIVADVLK